MTKYPHDPETRKACRQNMVSVSVETEEESNTISTRPENGRSPKGSIGITGKCDKSKENWEGFEHSQVIIRYASEGDGALGMGAHRTEQIKPPFRKQNPHPETAGGEGGRQPPNFKSEFIEIKDK